jgi:Ras-related protein Rab-21
MMVDIKKMKKKICLLGDAEVGKTSLIRRYVYDSFDDKYISTLGAKVSRKEINLQFSKNVDKAIPVNVILSIWDILGQKDESAERVRPVYYGGAHGALVVCDITRKETFLNITEWIKSIIGVTKKIPVAILGNKIDLYKEAEVFFEDLEKFSEENNYPVFLTSAKTNNNVEKAFIILTEQMLEETLSQ